MQAEYGDDLAVVFVESQGADEETQAKFALKQKWLGTSAMWTTERPFDSGSRGLPSFGLLDAEGKLILKGSSSMLHSAMKDAIEEQIALRRKGPKDMPKPLAKAYVDFGKGNYAKAIGAIEKILADEKTDATLKALADGAKMDLVGRVEAKFQRNDWLVENGFLLEAQAMLMKLEKGLKGNDQLLGLTRDRATLLGSPEMKPEFAAAKALAKIEAKLYEEGPGGKSVKSLQKFIEKNSGTRAAARAQGLLELAS
jgi:hypothetical protein